MLDGATAGWTAVAAVVAAWFWVLRRPGTTARSVAVVVLGDFGRSPRMQYHTLSLAAMGKEVDVIGYGGARPVEKIIESPSIRLRHIRAAPALPKGLPRVCFLLYAPIKVVMLTLQLLFVLLYWIPKPSHILVQNPPSIPTLPIVWLVCLLRGSTFVVDWHNYGFTILGLSVGESHWLTRFAHWIEAVFGKRSAENLCVTAAMQEDLKQNWGVEARVLHDRPPPMFSPTPAEVAHDLFKRLHAESPAHFGTFGACAVASDGSDTLFTDATGALRADRPALVVSSTSWTPDEDFGMLFKALELYEAACEEEGATCPDVLCAITGKGPLRAFYEKKVEESAFKHVRVATLWLAIEDYPRLLGSADVGISLHTSSSGLDLPMKVVDMFGCGLPVCAVNFKCLHELVKHEVNGLAFESADELGAQLARLLGKFPRSQDELGKYRENLKSFRENGWEHNWNALAKPIFD